MAFSNRYASIRYLQGLGSTGLYVRLVDQAGRFFVWANGTWSATEVAGCKAWLAETDDASVESRYSATVAIDTSLPTTLEYVRAADSMVLAEEPFAADFAPTTNASGGVALTTLDNVKGYIGKAADAVWDSLLTRIIYAVSQWFVGQVGQPIVNDQVVETIRADGTRTIVLSSGPVVSVSQVSVDGDTSHTYAQDGRILTFDRPAPHIGQTILVTYVAGWGTSVPADVEQAVIEMVALKFNERNRVGISNESSTGYSASFLPAMTPRSVQSVIDRYQRP